MKRIRDFLIEIDYTPHLEYRGYMWFKKQINNTNKWVCVKKINSGYEVEITE